MNDSTTKVNEVSTTLDEIKISSSAETLDSEPHPLSSTSAQAIKKFPPPHDVDAEHFSSQPRNCRADSVRHRLRGILITHDTYDLFRLSFEDDKSARTFLGSLLAAVLQSDHLIRMTEVQLEEVNSDWHEEARLIHPQFKPVNLLVIMAAEEFYSHSTQ